MNWKELRSQIVRCSKCPRLAAHREKVPTRKCFASEKHWRKPIPGFGDASGRLLIIGLAPSSEGANRTGRIFTGDASAKFLIQNLYRAGFANQATSESIDDGLQLNGCYLTAAVKCVPPQHRPTPTEIERCSIYLHEELHLLKNCKAVLVLGRIALDAYKQYLRGRGLAVKHVRFIHGARYEWEGAPDLYVSYHPSPQNTNTGVLTARRFQSLLKKVKNL
jgi:uracil-DNA glycosylase